MTKIIAYKGFNADLTCRDYQFEIGKTYQHEGAVDICSSGFHACEYPLDVFNYYGPVNHRFAEVEVSGDIAHEEEGNKLASSTITIKKELSLHQMVDRAVECIASKIDKSVEQVTNTGDQSAATNTGYRSVATNTGIESVATNTGYRSAATNTGYRSAATNTGRRSAATNTGRRSAAEVSGSQSVACALGIESKARASKYGAIVLCYRDEDGVLIHIRASKVGDNGVKPDTWYVLNANGEFKEADD